MFGRWLRWEIQFCSNSTTPSLFLKIDLFDGQIIDLLLQIAACLPQEPVQAIASVGSTIYPDETTALSKNFTCQRRRGLVRILNRRQQ